MAFLALFRETSDFVRTSTVTASSENTTYPGSLIQSMPVAQRTRTVAGVTTASWLIDAASAQGVKAVAILNHNFTEDVTATISAGSTSACSDYSQGITYRAGDMYYVLSGTQTYRYWKLEIADASNTDGYLSFGRLMLGVHDQLADFNFSFGWRRRRKSNNARQRTDLGVPHIEKRYKSRTLTFDFERMTATQETTLDTLIDSLDGDAVPALVIPDPDVYDGWLMRCVEEAEVEYTSAVYRSRHGVQFEEDPRGIRLA